MFTKKTLKVQSSEVIDGLRAPIIKLEELNESIELESDAIANSTSATNEYLRGRINKMKEAMKDAEREIELNLMEATDAIRENTEIIDSNNIIITNLNKVFGK